MGKLDLKKDLKHLYQPSAKEVTIVDVPAMNFIMFDGKGDPNTSPIFQEVTHILYGLSYTLKFMVKKGHLELDYAVMPLEGLWYLENGYNFDLNAKDQWLWTLMIVQPDFITSDMVEEARVEVITKKKLERAANARFTTYPEGLAAQIMHIGPYSAEEPTIARIHDFIATNGYELVGKHHEIYLGDPRKTKPENLKTVIRQPIKKK